MDNYPQKPNAMNDREWEQTVWYQTYLKPHEPIIRNWLRSRYSSQIDVDDIMQDALIRVIKARETCELKSPKSYFFATARNLAINSLRKRKAVLFSEPEVDMEAMNLLDDSESIDETVARNHELEILTRAIQALPDRCRKIFTLSKVYGMTYEEIAKELGISFHTVSSQIAIGLVKCRDYMRHHGRD